jgi:hypothetical protein
VSAATATDSQKADCPKLTLRRGSHEDKTRTGGVMVSSGTSRISKDGGFMQKGLDVPRIISRRSLRRLSVTILTATAAIGVAVPPANATLGACHPTIGDSYVSVYCDGSAPNSYQVWIYCSNKYAAYGTWETAGSRVPSYAQCAPNRFVFQWNVKTT